MSISIGIAETNLERIFEPFWSTKGIDGIGMDLASGYGIVKKHNGEVFAQSAPGQRTAFTVKLSLEEKCYDDGRRSLPDHALLAYRIPVMDDSKDSLWCCETVMSVGRQCPQAIVLQPL